MKLINYSWEQREFGDILDNVTDYVAAGSFADLAANVKYINIPDYAQLVRTTDLKSNFLNNDFIYVNKHAFDFLYRVNLNSECIIMPNIGNCGEIYYINPNKLPYKHNVLGPNAIYVRSSTNNNKFLSYSFKCERFQKLLKLIVSPNGQTKFNKTELKTLDVLITNKIEENKIGELFDNLDNLITLHQRKLKIFCSHRFFEPVLFCYSWEQRELGDLLTIERGGSPRPIDAYLTTEENGLNWVKIGDAPEQGRYITKTEEKIKPEGLSKTRSVVPGDLILSNSMSFGKPYIMSIYGCIHDGWLLLRDTNNCFDLNFLCHLLSSDQLLSQYKSLAAGSTVNNLNKDLVSKVTINLPSIVEQKIIGNYLESLDNLITLHQRKQLMEE